MIAPARAALFFLHAAFLGAALGLMYDLLRPLRPRLTALADLIFVLCLFAGWIFLAFGICGGDPRLLCTGAMALGFFLWSGTVGRWARPLIFRFWALVGRLLRLILAPIQKILGILGKFCKKLLAIPKKWVTIKTINPFRGGTGREKRKIRQAGAAQVQPGHKGRRGSRRHSVRGGAGGSARLHHPDEQPV